MTPKSELMARLRKQRAEAGLKKVETWVHPDDAAAIKALAAKLNEKRGFKL